MKTSEFRKLIREEIRNILTENQKLNEMAFTKMHYIAIANIIKASKNKEEITQKLADLFKKDNDRFDVDKFIKATK